MSYEQLAASVDALAEANRSLTEQSLETQAGSVAASDNATAKALEAAQAALSAEDSARVATDAANLAKDSTDIMDSTAAGIAAGKPYFYTVSPESSQVLILWKNNAGVAEDTGKKTPSVVAITDNTQNLWPDPFFKETYSKFGEVSVIPNKLSCVGGILKTGNPVNPYSGTASIDISSGAGIRNAALFIPFSEISSFKLGDKITAKVLVITNGIVRLDMATRSSLNSTAIQSTLDRKTGAGLVELSASLTLTSHQVGLFLRVQLDDTNTNTAAVLAVSVSKGIGTGYSEKALDRVEISEISNKIVENYKVPVLGTEFFRLGKNLYNPATRVDGSYLNVNNFPLENSAYFYSDYMPVTALSPYAANSILRFILFYDNAKVFLGASTSLEQLSQFTSPEGAAFIRVSVIIAMGQGLQIEAGAASTAYESYGYYMRTVDPHGTPIKVVADSPVTTQTRPNTYGFEYMRETHQRLRCLSLGDNVRINIGCIGDSWTHNSLRYIFPVFTTLKDQYGGLGDGWIGFAFAQANQTNGSVRGYNIAALAGIWTTAYATGSGPDAGSVTSGAAGATASATLSTYTAERNIYLLALGGSGSITYKVGGADAVTVDLSTMTGVQKINMGLITGSAAVVITVVSGSVTLFGMIESLTGKGVGVHKLGSTGSRASQWAALDPVKFKASLQALVLDLVVILLGTNDQAQPATKAAFKASIEVMLTNIREARPTADILLVAPCENMRGLPIPIKDYADAMYELAVKYQCAFVDLQPNFGEKPTDYSSTSQRPWFNPDGIHPDPSTGGRAIVSGLLKVIVN